MGPYFLESRTRLNMPQIEEWLEYLYHRVKAVAEEQHPGMKLKTWSINGP